MSEGQTLLLGFIAGGTIALGLPVARLRAAGAGLRQFLNALAVGILLFLIWDVLSHAYLPLQGALDALHTGDGGFEPIFGYATLFLGGIAVGLLGLVFYERWLAGRGRPMANGPGAMTRGVLGTSRLGVASWSAPRRLSLLIAVGIGLHNFGEGLAIGASAAVGAISLATLLVIGFALHNATEGFGIVAPLASEEERPSWRFLALMAVIGGGPTFVGTALGRQFTSPTLNMLFLTLAAGSILYVVIQLIGVAQKMGRKELLYLGVLAGLVAGFVTDMVVTAAGG
ncbi:MAG TPA: ZIP family metal transporter [Chloroflexota bacterium]|nr:ZIP family metal transporter [Chloroflexota bacterium]